MLKKDTPIIILHGWRLSEERFNPLLEVLNSQGFIVDCPDLPGFGKTPPPLRAWTLDDYVRYIVDYIDKKHYKKVVIIGHSFGGRVGVMLAVRHPELVRALMLTGTPGLPTESQLKKKFFLLLAKTGNTLLSLPILAHFKAMGRKILYKAAGTWDYYHAQGYLRETFQNIIAFDLAPLFPQIKTPTLVIWGKEDTIVPEKIGKKMAALIPNAEWLSIPTTNHALPYQAAEKFANEVERFLKSIHV